MTAFLVAGNETQSTKFTPIQTHTGESAELKSEIRNLFMHDATTLLQCRVSVSHSSGEDASSDGRMRPQNGVCLQSSPPPRRIFFVFFIRTNHKPSFSGDRFCTKRGLKCNTNSFTKGRLVRKATCAALPIIRSKERRSLKWTEQREKETRSRCRCRLLHNSTIAGPRCLSSITLGGTSIRELCTGTYESCSLDTTTTF